MENISIDRDSGAITSSTEEDLVEPVTSTTPMENDNARESNSNNAHNFTNNSNSTNSRCLEPVARMLIPHRPLEVNPFSRPRHFDALKSELARLRTFSQPPGWPISFIRPEDCAHAGFFFLQHGDKVQCAFCRGVVGEWEEGDNPMVEHRRHFPRCPFIGGLPVGNILIDGDDEEEENAVSANQEEVAGIDVCGPYAPDIGQLSLTTHRSAPERGEKPFGGNGSVVVSSLCVETCENGPAHPDSDLEEEVRKLREQTLCKICMDSQVGIVFLPCGHLVSCTRCATVLSNCALCRQPIKAVVRTYLS